jgi:malate dehydrogenase
VDIAVIGASGSVGHLVCEQLLHQRLMGPTDRLQLVGRRGGASETGVFGLKIDLLDAYSINAPEIEAVLDPEKIQADIIVMVAGETPAPDPNIAATRDAIALTNRPIFEYYANVLSQNAQGHELILIQSNPVELAVEIFAQKFDRHRVIGAGAYNDSLRFRREVAADFGQEGKQHRVLGYMLGEHGPNVVPLWSSVYVHGVSDAQLQEYIELHTSGRSLADLPSEVASARATLGSLLAEHEGEIAAKFVAALPPDVRALVKPWFAHWTARTSTATAHSVVDLIAELAVGHRVVLPLQVATGNENWLRDEFDDIPTVIGLPVEVDLRGWQLMAEMNLPEVEAVGLRQSADAIRGRLSEWMS